MMTTREQAYISVCEELNEPTLSQVQEILKHEDARLDLSGVYLPPRHFRCVLQLVEERPDIDELNLDGAKLSVEEARLLKKFLLRSCVSKLSLQRVKLDAASANFIRDLCIENPNLVSVALTDTCIPSSLIDEIMLIVDLNRCNAESLHLTSTPGVQQESSSVARWRLCSEKKNPSFSMTPNSLSNMTRRLVDQFVASQESVFSDLSFQPHFFDHPVQGMEAIRWATYSGLAKFQEPELGKSKACFSPSVHYDNRNLCAALNVLRLYDNLSKSLVHRRYTQPGLYVFRLFVDRSPVEVCVDDLVPCVHVGQTCVILGMSSCSSPFYAALLEKAVAKVIGGYRSIQELSLGDCIELLTGCTYFELNLIGHSISTSTTFDVLHALIENGHKLVACAVPRTSIEERMFEEGGVCCGAPYTVLKMFVCRRNDTHYAFLLQVAAPSTGKPLKCAFEYDIYQTEEVNGHCVFWLTLEDFAVLFEHALLLLWPFEDALLDLQTSVELHSASETSLVRSQFARNPSFLIQNEGNSPSAVLVSLLASSAPDIHNETRCFFHRAAGAGIGAPLRRYNISENNAIFESDEFKVGEGSLFFNLFPTESLQMTLSSRVPSSFRIRISAAENVSVKQLPDVMASSTFFGQWNTVLRTKRFSDDIFRLEKAGAEFTGSLLLALSQSTRSTPPFPVGVFGWKGTSIDVVDVTKPHFSTQEERSTVCVHGFMLTLAADESFFLLPYCFGGRCPADYDLTVFCKESFTHSRVKTASVLRCKKT
ncbi:hypothetical protein JKF63_06591 [Porcisia hertigi]|uniref:Calpain catalytic domain-containing protein n=1 Tax=Porcisia hertigi TaxID=2761500 RepID=A0A836HXM2_9TRYP|nr:hypothetical protein JKF63_06591 [Porcisia hertigi]